MSKRNAFTEELRSGMNARGVNQTDLAVALGTTPSSVSMWSTGDRRPGPEVVFEIEHILRMRPGQLSRHLGYLPLNAVKWQPRSLEEEIRDAVLPEPAKMIAIMEQFSPVTDTASVQ